MALKIDSSITNNTIHVNGDLGDLQITEVSDSGEDKQNDSTSVSTLADFPSDLIKSSSVPVFGNVAVTDSENVQFGNNTYFNGPVIIKQVIHKSGIDNPSYVVTDDQKDIGHINNSKHEDTPLKGNPNLVVWHKLTLSAVFISVLGGVLAIVFVLQNKSEEHSSSKPHQHTVQHQSAPDEVVGNYYEYFQVILLFPITCFLMVYSLLTKRVSGSIDIAVKKKEIHENCVIKSCTTCNEEENPLLIAPDIVRIVSRTDWLAQPVEKDLDPLNLPAPWVIIAHTATETCSTQSQCVLRVRLIQTFHIESRGWNDIGYNFLVGGDGSVYFGRGWDKEGAHTKYYNRFSIGIAFIGTFNSEEPPKQQVDACIRIIREGVKLGKIAKDYKLFAHRQLMSTLSPGDKIVDIIQTWPHYVHNVSNVSDLSPSRVPKP